MPDALRQVETNKAGPGNERGLNHQNLSFITFEHGKIEIRRLFPPRPYAR
jgi:hypothetical protein